MTDRELLELAAKAAGIEVTPHPNNRISPNYVFLANGQNWNPLTDDGDAQVEEAIKYVFPEAFK